MKNKLSNTIHLLCIVSFAVFLMIGISPVSATSFNNSYFNTVIKPSSDPNLNWQVSTQSLDTTESEYAMFYATDSWSGEDSDTACDQGNVEIYSPTTSEFGYGGGYSVKLRHSPEGGYCAIRQHIDPTPISDFNSVSIKMYVPDSDYCGLCSGVGNLQYFLVIEKTDGSIYALESSEYGADSHNTWENKTWEPTFESDDYQVHTVIIWQSNTHSYAHTFVDNAELDISSDDGDDSSGGGGGDELISPW